MTPLTDTNHHHIDTHLEVCVWLDPGIVPPLLGSTDSCVSVCGPLTPPSPFKLSPPAAALLSVEEGGLIEAVLKAFKHLMRSFERLPREAVMVAD